MQQNIYVTQTNTNRGCFSGCGTTIAVVLLIGLAVQYWYISAALVLIGAGAGVWYYRTQRNTISAPAAAASEGPVKTAVACGECGHATTGNFCANCGAAQTRSCAHCGLKGLTSPFCPECGAATYTPPTLT